jgi:hypothetical protein
MTVAAKTVAARTATGQIRGLQISALAGLLMLLVEYGLGVWTNLYAQLPSSDHGKATLAAFGGAVAHGPAVLFPGTKFVSDQANTASFSMAVAAGVAILGYAIVLFIVVPAHDRGQRASGG